MRKNKSLGQTSVRSRSRRSTPPSKHSDDVRTLYTNFSSSFLDSIQFNHRKPQVSISNMLQHRLASYQSSNNKQIKRVSKQAHQLKQPIPRVCNQSVQTDPITSDKLFPTIEAKLRMLQLENQQIKQLLKSRLGIRFV